jgi:sulfide:quinone oxidoreductase
VGGLTAANALRQQLQPEHHVVLVDKTGQHLFAPSLLWLMVGARRREQLTKDLRMMLRPGVEMVRADVQQLDTERQRVLADGRELGYDALIVALGADLAPDSLPGFAEAAHSFFDLDGAGKLWEALRGFSGGRVIVAVTALPFKCPAAPYEAALLIDDALRQRGVRIRSEIMIVTPEPQPMPVAGPVLGEAIIEILKRRDIRYAPNRALASIDPGQRELTFADGTREAFDLLAGVPPHRAPPAVAASPLAGPTGWVPVDKQTLRTRFDHVYAVGDVTAITLANGKLLPRAGVFAHAEALAVARSLVAELQSGREGAFDGAGYCWVEMGRGEAGFATGNFYAEPNPEVRLRTPGRLWHLGKVLFEKYWMGQGVTRLAAKGFLVLGGRVLGIPARL